MIDPNFESWQHHTERTIKRTTNVGLGSCCVVLRTNEPALTNDQEDQSITRRIRSKVLVARLASRRRHLSSPVVTGVTIVVIVVVIVVVAVGT